MTDNRKILSLLGLARKAGKISEGSFKAENSIRSGKAALVIFSGDASAGTRRKISGICRTHGVPFIGFGNMAENGRAVGASDISVIAIEDDGFASKIAELAGQAQVSE